MYQPSSCKKKKKKKTQAGRQAGRCTGKDGTMHNNRSIQCEKGITGNSPRGLEGIVINAEQAITPTGPSHQSLFGGKMLRWRRRAHTNRYGVTGEGGEGESGARSK